MIDIDLNNLRINSTKTILQTLIKISSKKLYAVLTRDLIVALNCDSYGYEGI